MKQIFTISLLLISSLLGAQNTSDFENFTVAADSFLNGSDGITTFSDGFISMSVDYNEAWMSWEGWSISNSTDTSTMGFMNQYSAIPGMGADSSSNYAVSFRFGQANILRLENDAAGKEVAGLMVTNGTYPYLSMLNGDSFAKKFGGVTGDDPDFFLLTIKAYKDGVLSTDSVDFYLADYRFSDNSQDYIVDEWTFVDLSSLGQVDSLSFGLSSSDTGAAGMNTPGYFCIDNVQTEDAATGIFGNREELAFSFYPNPSSELIKIQGMEGKSAHYSIYDLSGREIVSEESLAFDQQFSVNNLQPGYYLLKMRAGNKLGTEVFIKK
ncbi:MAG: DUF4465 domain-containing protein [Bacteroidia bacterium]|nr:DUF4465 domain-containing protein [Bacteroidia bacterium]